jgi:membrane associated rhomboid family serine protease
MPPTRLFFTSLRAATTPKRTMEAAALAMGHFGERGGFGRIYRDRHDFRRDYRERANVGGLLGHILDSREFDLFLTLLIALICLKLVQSFREAPVTALVAWLIAGLHYQKSLGYEVLNANDFHKLTFHCDKILHGSQWYRLFTAPFLHSGRKLILYLNLSALAALSLQEREFQHPPLNRAVFLLALTGVSGLVYILLCNKYKRGALNTFTCGFMGVLFALKAYLNSTQTNATALSFPLLGDYMFWSLPIHVPGYAAHFVELILVSFFFPDDVSWYSNLAGVITGHLFYAATILVKDFRRSEFALLLVVTYLAYKVTDVTRPLQQQRHPFRVSNGQHDDEQPICHDVPSEVYAQSDGSSVASTSQNGKPSSLNEVTSDDTSSKESLAERETESVRGVAAPAIASDDEYSMLRDAETRSQIGMPDSVAQALGQLTCKSDTEECHSQTVAYSLRTILEIIRNATTLGQHQTKYRTISVDNKRITKCIDGAKALILELGFELKEDFDGRQHFVYPRQEIPDWIPAAIEAITAALANYEGSKTVPDSESIRAARLRKLEKKPKSRRPRESQFTPGMGGGNSKALYFHGGT